jgi:hypothetical protein
MRGSDPKILALIAPVFALVTAVNVITISYAKSLFIANNPYEMLPWMFIGGGIFATLVTLFYVTTIDRWSSEKRISGLFIISGVSYAIIALLTAPFIGLEGTWASLAIYAWCSGMSPLMIVQTWSWSSQLLDVRLARRLFPITSALATIGAAAGGAATRGVVEFGGITTLISLAAVLAWISAIFTRRASRLVPKLVPQDSGFIDIANLKKKKKRSVLGNLPEAFQALGKIPLLGRLALLTFLVQAASVVLDFQFSSALKNGFEDDIDMAGFLGAYYFGANILTLIVALFLAGPITRWLGIGMASSAAALVLIVGGLCIAILSSLGIEGSLWLGLSPVFWMVVATSFGERLASFGVAKQAIQAAQMPIPPVYLESTRFLISGVMTRLAVVGVSVGIMVWGSDLAQYEDLSPLLVVMSGLAVIVGMGLGARYRSALLDVLTDDRSRLAKVLPDWARFEAVRIVTQMLSTKKADDIPAGLALCRELGAEPPEKFIDKLLRDDDLEVVRVTLEEMRGGLEVGQPIVPKKSTLSRLLQPEMPAAIISVALAILPHDWTEFEDLVHSLMEHEDEGVSSRAILWLRSSVLGPATRKALRQRVRVTTGTIVPESDLEAPDEESFDDEALFGSGRSVGALTREFVKLVDRLPVLLRSESPKLQRIALDLFVDLALPEHVEMLITGLEDESTRAVSIVALGRMPPNVVIPAVQKHLAEHSVFDQRDPSEMVRRVCLLKALERLGEHGVPTLIEHLDSEHLPERHQAATSLAQLGRQEELRALISPEQMSLQVIQEVDSLCMMAVIDGALALKPGTHLGYLRSELRIRRVHGEVRMFRLLGLVYNREAVERAYAHYRSPQRRQRSNALELLDTTITDQPLRAVLAYVESTEYDAGRPKTTSGGMGQLPAFAKFMRRFMDASVGDPLGSLLAEHDGWIYELYTWAVRLDSGELILGGEQEAMSASGKPSHEEVMLRLFLLKGVDIFRDVPADQLLPLAHVARRVSFKVGEIIFEEGAPGDELFVVANGAVAIEKGGGTLATLRQRAPFGEMAILEDAGHRSAAARAVEATDCLVIGRDDFYGLFDIAPGLARGVIKVLVERARKNMDE